ncbi:sulfite exporter TauE/SafE family protein [Candidatus Saccharibacteria bacterium]|nr:MAG: sulfite exporter TauE/SafE family protein [Candidatus Saccharibacteria bacterium]
MEKDIIILLVGIVVGAMNAIAGGGMLIGFPVLLSLGVPPLVANITANIITPPGQIAAVYAYRSYLRRVPKRYILILPFVAVGALAGALTLRAMPGSNFADMVPLLILFGVALFAFQPSLHLHLHSHLHGRKKTLLPILLIGLALMPITFYGGFFGAGYGFIMLAFLGLGKVHEVHMLAAMKNVSAILVSLISIAVLYSTGLVDWHIGLVMAVGTTIGGYLGAHAAKRVSSYWLRIAVIIIGLAAATHLALKNYS